MLAATLSAFFLICHGDAKSVDYGRVDVNQTERTYIVDERANRIGFLRPNDSVLALCDKNCRFDSNMIGFDLSEGSFKRTLIYNRRTKQLEYTVISDSLTYQFTGTCRVEATA